MLLPASPSSHWLGFLIGPKTSREKSPEGSRGRCRHQPVSAVFLAEDLAGTTQPGDVCRRASGKRGGLDGRHDVIDVELARDRCHAAPPPRRRSLVCVLFTADRCINGEGGIVGSHSPERVLVTCHVYFCSHPGGYGYGRDATSVAADAHGCEGV